MSDWNGIGDDLDGGPDYRCHRFDGRVGYRGQKYEVRFVRNGKESVFGWQNESSGGLADAAKLMPGVTNVRIVECGAGDPPKGTRNDK